MNIELIADWEVVSYMDQEDTDELSGEAVPTGLLAHIRIAGADLHLEAIRAAAETQEGRRRRTYSGEERQELKLDALWMIDGDGEELQTVSIPGYEGHWWVFATPFQAGYRKNAS